MVRIVHIGYAPVSLKSLNQHATGIKLSNGFIRNGHQLFTLSDRDIARGFGLGHRRLGRHRLNRMVREFCRAHKPELMVLGHADMLDPATIAAIRDELPGMRAVQWNVDPLFEPDNIRRIESKMDVVDLTLVTTAGPSLEKLRRPGARVGFMPNPVDLSIERARMDESETPPFDLFYACGHPDRPRRIICGQPWNMEEFIKDIAARQPGIRTRTPGLFGQPRVTAAAYQEALATASMGLNISRRADDFLYSSDRLAQLTGNGLLAIIERATGYNTLFGDDEMGFFSNLEELAELLARYRADPRARMRSAGAGRRHYVELFNERRVAAYLVDAAFGDTHATTYPWPGHPA
ncbi:glycosyltransferase family protein [Acidocella sp.]|uniref:glycosyltransferase family protein n=1 Tax=Acidocella sp. TaxID=50710 RepID=UPI003D042AB0